MNKLTNGKVERIKEWKNPSIEKDIISKLSLEEMEYLRGQGIFNQQDIIIELLNRIRQK